MPQFRGAYRRHHGDRYGPPHQHSRAAAFAALPEHSPCARCGHDMWKHAKTKPDRAGITRSAIHYDHDEHGTYLGFSHGTPCPTCGRSCNRDAGAAKGGRVRARKYGPWRGAQPTQPRLPTPWRSRTW